MKNTEREVRVYTLIIDQLEESLFEKLRSLRSCANRQSGTENSSRVISQKVYRLFDRLVIERQNLNSAYGFSHLDAHSHTLISEICTFTGLNETELFGRVKLERNHELGNILA